ncbi:MAG: asparagine synthase-related protein [Rhodospirillaceae bacterium]
MVHAWVPKNDAYIDIKRSASGPVVEGLRSHAAGHRIPSASGEVPDGVFFSWDWDGSRLSVRNCRYGLYPLYYFVRDGGICLSMSIPRLLLQGAPTDLDEAAVALFLRLGWFCGEDTPFRHIRTVPPAAHFEWRDGRLDVSGARPQIKPQRMDRDAAIDAYIELFRDAMAKRATSDDIGLPLSGGRDSRRILLELNAQGRRPRECVTVRHPPPRHNEDARCATMLAEAVGAPHVILDPHPSRMREEMRKNLLTSFCCDELAEMLRVVDHLEGNVAHVYDGLGGNFVSADPYLEPKGVALYEARDWDALADHFMGAWEPNEEIAFKSFLRPEQNARFGRELAKERLMRELPRFQDDPRPTSSFIFWTRQRREVAQGSYGLFDAGQTVFVPFLDHALFDVMTSLPSSMFMDHKFHTDTILRAYPAFAHIPFEDKYAKLAESRAYARRIALDLAAYLMRRGKSRFVNLTYVLPRLFRCAVDGDRRGIDYFYPVLVLWLVQLEAMIEACSRDTRAAEAA